MKENDLQLRNQGKVRKILRWGGLTIILIALIFMLVGLIGFFSAFGGTEPPRYLWCLFIALPLLFIGSIMTMFGFMASVHRYVAGESAPVAGDVVNYMGEKIQPGVRSVARSVSEGIYEARAQQEKKKNPDGK